MGRQRQRVIDRREDLGLTRDRVAEALGIGPKSYERFELGHQMLRVGRRPQLARLLDWTPEQLRLAVGDEDPLLPNGHAVPSWLGHLASLEQAASQLWSFEPIVVNGLLQTREYATAVERADSRPRSEEGTIRRVDARMARQGVLTREPESLFLAVVLDESVLHRVAGNEKVMADQLDHLVTMSEWPNITLRVLPLSAGVFIFGGFIVLTSAGSDDPYMACTEDRVGQRYHDRAHELEAHVTLFEYLSGVALPPDEARDLIRSVAKERYQ